MENVFTSMFPNMDFQRAKRTSDPSTNREDADYYEAYEDTRFSFDRKVKRLRKRDPKQALDVHEKDHESNLLDHHENDVIEYTGASLEHTRYNIQELLTTVHQCVQYATNHLPSFSNEAKTIHDHMSIRTLETVVLKDIVKAYEEGKQSGTVRYAVLFRICNLIFEVKRYLAITKEIGGADMTLARATQESDADFEKNPDLEL
jgi:hypothetical protein